MKELKLKQYGLLYPVPILKILFCYIHDNNIRINNTGFYPFLIAHKFLIMIGTQYQNIHSKKITLHLFSHAVFLLFFDLLYHCNIKVIL